MQDLREPPRVPSGLDYHTWRALMVCRGLAKRHEQDTNWIHRDHVTPAFKRARLEFAADALVTVIQYINGGISIGTKPDRDVYHQKEAIYRPYRARFLLAEKVKAEAITTEQVHHFICTGQWLSNTALSAGSATAAVSGSEPALAAH